MRSRGGGRRPFPKPSRPTARASARRAASTVTPSLSALARCARRREPGRRAPLSAWSIPASAPMRSRNSSRPAKAPGSMARSSWPTAGGGPSASKKELASKPKCAPVRATASTSTIIASAAPLAPPMGCSAPLRAALASVVGRPCSSTAQSAGMGSPRCPAVRILPRATWLRAMSTTIGGASRCGAAKASGLVPNRARLPPQGAIALGVLPNASATRPASASRSTWRPTTPKWCERTKPAAAMPLACARPGSRPTTRSMAGKTKPLATSIIRAPGRVWRTTGVAWPSTLPTRACAA